MPRYLFSSHDGFGLGHVRRNTLIARALLEADPTAEITIVTGLTVRPAWLQDPRLTVVRVPGLVKDASGSYVNRAHGLDGALARRAQIFERTVRRRRPDVVVVDRHPYGTAGELVAGLDAASSCGAALVLGLRDVLDESPVIRREVAGPAWVGVRQRYDDLLVYGGAHLCDHEAEYGIPGPVTYCGWIADTAPSRARDPHLLVVTGGGGGDGAHLVDLGMSLARLQPSRRTVVVTGPYAGHLPGDLDEDLAALGLGDRLHVHREVGACAPLFAEAGAVVQMAGYNSTFEALAAGVRPILVPRRHPRREQAIRATRLAALGLADVVDDSTTIEEVSWLLAQPRLLPAGALAGAGISLDGASRAAAAVSALAARAVA